MNNAAAPALKFIFHRIMLSGKDKTILLRVRNILRTAVVVVSLLLIVIISINVFRPGFIPLDPHVYNRAQLPACLVYLADYFYELWINPSRRKYFVHNIPTLLICIPYAAILQALGVHPGGVPGYIIHYMPTMRAVLAIAVLTRFVSSNRVVGIFASYLIILVMTVYFASLVFYIWEGGVNPAVKNYWDSLYWCMLQTTTLGASFYAVTTAGKAVAMIISVMGLLMFPLFTVYLTDTVKKYTTRDNTSSKGNS